MDEEGISQDLTDEVDRRQSPRDGSEKVAVSWTLTADDAYFVAEALATFGNMVLDNANMTDSQEEFAAEKRTGARLIGLAEHLDALADAMVEAWRGM